jgi:Predicted ribosomal protein
MIKVTYQVVNDVILGLKVLGHADYSKLGELDLVCACVSSIVIGGLNQINDDKNYKMKVNSGDVKVVVSKANNNDDIVLKTIVTQLRTLETKYPKNLNVKNE